MFSSGVPTSKFGSRCFPRGYRHQIFEIIDVFLRGSNITVAILAQGIRRVHASELTFGHLFLSLARAAGVGMGWVGDGLGWCWLDG